MVAIDQEQEWIERSRQGDHAAYENLVRCHQQMIHAIAYRMTGSMADAQDLAQETFIRAFQQLGTYRGEAKFSSWLCRVAINATLNWRARERRRTEVHQQWTADQDQAASATGGDGAWDENSRRVQASLDRLPAKQRAAMVLTVFQEMSQAEAARALRCSEATVAWRVFAARGKLRRWLRPDRKEEPT